MRTNLIGKTVTMGKRYAKWHLDNPDIYGAADYEYKEFDTESVMHMLCCMGEPVFGVVIEKGSFGCWLIEYEVAGLKTEYYVERKDFTII